MHIASLRRIVSNMGTNAVQRDATAETVSANVKRLRIGQNLGLRGLATKLGEVGRPLGHSAVDQIEKGKRRVDVDDLLALAAALGVSPATLLMPDAKTGQDAVSVTGHPDPVSAARAWSWFAHARPISEEVSLVNFIANAWPSWRVREFFDELMKGAPAREERLVDEHGGDAGTLRFYPIDVADSVPQGDSDGDD